MINFIDMNLVTIHNYQGSDFVSQKENDKLYLPILGTVSCGLFKLASTESDDYLEIPKSFLGNADYFVLKANGQSMIHAGIDQGDLVIIEKNRLPENGEIAVVRVDDDVVLKKFYRLEDQEKYMLKPENSDYPNIIIDNCDVIGVAVKIIKDIKMR